MLVGAVIGRPCKIIKGATDDRPYEEYDGRQKPLLEERCHEVTEWWQYKNPQTKKQVCVAHLFRECEKKSVKNNPSMIEYK